MSIYLGFIVGISNLDINLSTYRTGYRMHEYGLALREDGDPPERGSSVVTSKTHAELDGSVKLLTRTDWNLDQSLLEYSLYPETAKTAREMF